jgi:acetoin utilization deacetylase AcuC-like enzyme
MLIFCSPLQALHLSQQFMRRGRFVPTRDTPERAANILAALREAGHAIHQAPPHGIAPVAAVQIPEFLDDLATAWRGWQAIEGAADEVMPNVSPERAMEHGYPAGIIGRAGYRVHDLCLPIGRNTWDAAAASANLALEAEICVLGGAPFAYAPCRPSGHHAVARMGGGSCYLNNAAIAAEVLRRGHARVAIVDVDVHHDNVPQGMFSKRSDLLFVSLHRDPIDDRPFVRDHAHERQEGEGLGFTLNLPLPAHSGDDVALGAGETACARLVAHAAGALRVSLGTDGRAEDPLRGVAVTETGFHRIGVRLAALRLPTVIVQEGGYTPPTIGHLVITGLAGFDAGRLRTGVSGPE